MKRIGFAVAALCVAACSPGTDSADNATDTIANATGDTFVNADTDPGVLAGVIADAAEARDHATLSAHMADAFSYSFGLEPSRQGALARYREEPELLDELARVLHEECATKALGTENWYVCPAAAADESQAYYGWRAGFRQQDDGAWEFVWFIAGD